MREPPKIVERARAARRAGDLTMALELYREAERAFDQDLAGRAHCLRHSGELALMLDRKQEARQALNEAEALYRSGVDDILSLANTIRLLAILDDGAERWSQARSLYQRAQVESGLDLREALEECDYHIGQL